MERKKRIGIILIFCGVALLFVSRYMLNNNKLTNISKNLGIDATNCKIVEDKNTHGGFLGDGEYFAKLTCNEQEETGIKINWIELPLSEELVKAMEIKQCGDNGCKDSFERFDIPKENGYYTFTDRHSYSTNHKDDSEINNRSSYNFSIGIYSNDSKNLYYYELDT